MAVRGAFQARSSGRQLEATAHRAVADGSIIPTSNLPLSQAAVSVTIGGQLATVTYHGVAPGLVAGVMQINAQIPAGITPGAAVPVAVSAGGAAVRAVL